MSGTGAKIAGGRWNPAGIAVVYASESHSLSVLEALVHFEKNNVPKDYFLVEIDVPDHLKKRKVEISDLPPNWRDYPGPDSLKKVGREWAETLATPVLSVPSAVNIYGRNFLLNPAHPDFNQIKVVKYFPIPFDKRLEK